MQTPVAAILAFGPVPFNQQLRPLLLRKNVELCNRLFRTSNDAFHQRLQMLQHPFNSHVIEKIGVVFKREIQTVCSFSREQHQIKLRGSAFGSYALKRQSTKFKLLSR